MEFDVTLEGQQFRVVVAMDDQGIDIEEIYAPDSEVDISYFMDAWHKTAENEVLKQLEEQSENQRG